MKTKTNNGFTLVEILIIIAIAGMLAAIAVPNYNEYRKKTKEREKQAEAVKVEDNTPTLIRDKNISLPSGEKLVSASVDLAGEAIILSRPFRYDDKIETYTFRSINFTTGKEANCYHITEQR